MDEPAANIEEFLRTGELLYSLGNQDSVADLESSEIFEVRSRLEKF